MFSTAAAEEPEELWRTRTELSYTKTSGNTDNMALACKLKVKKESTANRYFLTGKTLYAEDRGREISNQVLFEARWERVLSERSFGVLTTGYHRDKFAGYEYRLFSGPGVGYDLLRRDRHKLQSLISLVYYHDELYTAGKESDGYVTGTAGVKYEWKVLRNLKLRENLNYLVSFKESGRYFIDSETAVEARVNGALSLGMSYVISYQSRPPVAGIKHTDTTFLTTLIIDF